MELKQHFHKLRTEEKEMKLKEAEKTGIDEFTELIPLQTGLNDTFHIQKMKTEISELQNEIKLKEDQISSRIHMISQLDPSGDSYEKNSIVIPSKVIQFEEDIREYERQEQVGKIQGQTSELASEVKRYIDEKRKEQNTEIET